MISKNQIKAITALQHKKFRREEREFVAEGEKVVSDLLRSEWRVKSIYGTQLFFQNLDRDIRIPKNIEVILVTDLEMEKISGLTTPQQVLAVAAIPEDEIAINYEKGLKLVLDGINDPGNLGTLIRIADWFGIDEVICSENTVDCFNLKVVMGAMGSLFRVRVIYKNLLEVFEQNLSMNKIPVYGTVLDGKSIYEEDLIGDSFILVGNESAGIDHSLERYITKGITIPSFKATVADSLNVAVATGIVCAEFRR